MDTQRTLVTHFTSTTPLTVSHPVTSQSDLVLPAIAGTAQLQKPASPLTAKLNALSIRPSSPSLPETASEGTQRLEHYDLLKTLGAGAFGKVLLVRDRRTDRKYALKVLEKKRIVKLKQVEHTVNERNILANIEFPFIACMSNSFKDQRNVYIALEFVPCGELFKHLRQEDHFTESRTRFYATQVVLALEYLHQKQIVHRDLKPENLLMDARGYIKLADFGFAKFVEDRTYTMCGTPEYTAPEVIKRKGHNKAVDWWALGVLMYEMACGFTPFEVPQRDRLKMYEKILKANIKYPRHFTEQLCHVISMLLEVDPAKRFGSLPGGVADIKKHSFFLGTDWTAIYWKTAPAPFVPTLKTVLDVSNFDQSDDATPSIKTTTSFECPVDFPGF